MRLILAFFVVLSILIPQFSASSYQNSEIRAKRGIWSEAWCEQYTCPNFKKCKQETFCVRPFTGQHRRSCKKLCTDGSAKKCGCYY